MILAGADVSIGGHEQSPCQAGLRHGPGRCTAGVLLPLAWEALQDSLGHDAVGTDPAKCASVGCLAAGQAIPLVHSRYLLLMGVRNHDTFSATPPQGWLSAFSPVAENGRFTPARWRDRLPVPHFLRFPGRTSGPLPGWPPEPRSTWPAWQGSPTSRRSGSPASPPDRQPVPGHTHPLRTHSILRPATGRAH